jgi:hypothetical protein
LSKLKAEGKCQASKVEKKVAIKKDSSRRRRSRKRDAVTEGHDDWPMLPSGRAGKSNGRSQCERQRKKRETGNGQFVVNQIERLLIFGSDGLS